MSLRAAGLVECYHIYRHQLGLDTCVVLSARYTCADGASLTKEQLFPALRKVIETHAALGVKLEGEDAKPSFVRLETIELPLIVRFSDHDGLEAAVGAQLARPFDTLSLLPLWRVEVLNDGTVILALHHGIGDGLSCVAFHQCLLAALQQDVLPGDDSTTVAVPPALTLSPPIETLTNLWPSLRKIVTELFYMLAPASWTPDYSAWTANPVSPTPVLAPRAKLLAFTPADAAALAAACRAHNTTITAALYVLTIVTLSRLAPPSAQHKTFSAHIAISLRGAARLPTQTMGDYATAHHTYPPLDPVFSWPAAARYAQELQRQRLVAREEFGLLHLLGGVQNIRGFLRGRLGSKRGSTFEISNAGRVSVAADPDVGRWTLGQMTFAQCDVVAGSALKLNVIGDPAGALSVTLTWGADAIDEKIVEAFAEQFRDGVKALVVGT
ncbi:alcohol acetyltransferase [Mycena belliarum]|uniref:Alcohol acetyltransferase n=1 Tax=Mycena belliarum TaxID=1033014 RepID=A0AAD6U881_9AGAR|nr:alcohol acetyltransferase [Mycena belliae]